MSQSVVHSIRATKSCTYGENRVIWIVLQINPKKFKPIKNKTIPNPMRPRFRNKAQANIYFLSKRKVTGEKKNKRVKNLKLISILLILLIGGFILSN